MVVEVGRIVGNHPLNKITIYPLIVLCLCLPLLAYQPDSPFLTCLVHRDNHQCSPHFSNCSGNRPKSRSKQWKFSEGVEARKAKIELNFHIQRQLGYIQTSNPSLKFLIDTGANQSFISPEAVKKYFNHIPLNYDPFEVTNVYATSKNNYSITYLT